ncbi:tRNA pseudouridine(38-40) synthase TruA [Marinospirillum alkaliphilum]|uniref:tRNA pseudouridine synthase A n=1 Tax=Marinospirillum alkaliphilum DSM 21637 TaxID=1122209 RepID=A0A1K1X4V9_9GAMM|nr:tRNA pseudouridine(38-40) synthase TruA [Marinospirillum alkaliphilum]SFX44339.1 tRNA pseudouridine38-40 synthase [Marinospirillum alkaliphilum DSM 21637]
MPLLTDPFDLFPSDDATPGRIALGVEYLGSGFRGWQTQQTGVPSIQPWLESALSKVAGETISVMCAGRTDAGVHATGQVVHFDTSAARPSRAWVFGCNGELPPDIRIRWAKPMPHDFHARYSAIARRYRYVIINHRMRPAQMHDQLTWWNKPLDVEKMHEAAQYLIGEKDFSAFRSAKCESSTPWRHMHFIRVYRRGQLLVVDIQANAFLHHMVRNIVGTLLAVGQGDRPVSWVKELLDLKKRQIAGITAPAQGLYLVAALYPERFGLPCESLGPHFMQLLADEHPDDPYPEFLPEWHRTHLTRMPGAANNE